MIRRSQLLAKKTICAPIYCEDIFESAQAVLDSGFEHEKQQKASFSNLSEVFSLQLWDKAGFISPPVIEKHQIYTGGGKSTQEARLKFVYHEPNELGFASIIVLSLEMSRGLPAESSSVCPPNEVLHGAKWTLQELKYLVSPFNKKLVCLSW